MYLENTRTNKVSPRVAGFSFCSCLLVLLSGSLAAFTQITSGHALPFFSQFARLDWKMEAAKPYRLIPTAMRQYRLDGPPTPRMKNDDELIAALRKQLEQDGAEDRFSGVALIARNGKPIFAEAYGLADREHKIPNVLKTRFRIGSMNKMFTAVATLQLMQAGKLALSDPLGKYLTEYPNKDVATKVTIRHLLMHTGGTGDIFGPDFQAHRAELRTLEDYVKLYGGRGLKFEPGRWEYSNYGFILLGVIIEKVSGENYYDYVSRHIYEPADMTSSGSEPEEQTVSDRSIGYTKIGADGSGWQPNSNVLPYRGTSAGGGYSTAEDLLKFANALRENKLLEARNTDLLTTGKIARPDGRYAFGFLDRNINGIRCFGHGGGAPGMNSDLEICQNFGSSYSYAVVVLANLDPPIATEISYSITSRLPEQ